MRTQVAIIGAGPAGMFLAFLLKREGLDCVVIERQGRDYVEARVRAGVLEQFTADLMSELGLGARLKREGLVHAGTNIACDGSMFRIDFQAVTGGKSVIVYGQQEVMRDLFDAAAPAGIEIHFEAKNVSLKDIETEQPKVEFAAAGVARTIVCDFIAGCDGSHGISRAAIPESVTSAFERVYPFGWLGILADVPPVNEELIYCNHARGFALASMRSPTRSRYYLQCSLEDRIEDWPDERFWNELSFRLGDDVAAHITRGPSFEKTIAPLRSFVVEPMQFGRLFLAGDAAHIVPPTGAKGLNLAVSDVHLLARGFAEHYRDGRSEALNGYSTRALERVWKAERFSWWFTSLTHRFPGMDGFDRRIQLAEILYLRQSKAAQAAFAENYVGLPIT